MIWVFEKASGFQLVEGSSLAQKSLKFCKNVTVVWIFFEKLLVKANSTLITYI